MSTEPKPTIICRLCGKTPHEIKGFLHRVNEKGVTGIWECRPSCNSNLTPDEALIAAVEGGGGEMLSQPLTTEDGALNPACMNELGAAIAASGPACDRLSGDPEWSKRDKEWTFAHDIVGAFAMWACRQSPYGVPDGLENVCKYLHAALKTAVNWDANGMAELSLCDINRLLREILYEQGVAEFDAWNRCKKGETPEINFVSAYDGPTNPDRDFIDLDALLQNVSITIRTERREDARFDAKFEEESATGEKAPDGPSCDSLPVS